ncbi:alkaline phosphatase family protein [Fodinibius salsisoli]|uniref:Alkaline phosphatase family protein n=1 Tax=Fodinibius salsisoli TaxID=2820877 RepID=A0ABT3PL18_9BACT|nr:alkaline phosphatase family protein [Fodinibius salsisoli]MCW9706636.1 alkaline phosphatase family protein [Fodinibius salsisoli]
MKKLFVSIFVLLFVSQAYGQTDLKTENVFLITLDGTRWQEVFTGADGSLIGDEEYVDHPKELKKAFWADRPEERREKLMPFFWNTLAKEGQLYGNRRLGSKINVRNPYWFSYPGYSEILVGYVDKGVDSNAKRWNPNTTVLEFIENQPGFEEKVAAFGSWDVFPYIINEKRSDVPVNAGFEKAKGSDLTEKQQILNELLPKIPSPWDYLRLDAFTHYYALEHIKKNKPRLAYIAYGETDDFAHGGDFESYLESAHKTDGFIRELWDYVQSDPQYQNKTTFIIATDHGRGTEPKENWRHHGSDVEGADEVWLAVIGPDSPALGEVEKGQLYQTQVAQTVAYLLGLEYENKKPVGQVIDTIFDEGVN